MVVRKRHQDRLLTPENTDGQRDSGVLQRQVTAGMSERELVYVFGGCTVQNRGLVHTLQPEASPFYAGLDDPVRICQEVCRLPE